MIIGVKQVEDGSGPLRVSAGDIVTPLARERARDLDREIVVEGGGAARGAQSASEARAAGLARNFERRGGRPGRPATAPSPGRRAAGPRSPGPHSAGPPSDRGSSSMAEVTRPPLTGITYRRGGKVHGLVPEGGPERDRGGGRGGGTGHGRVVCVGAGHVGTTAALRCVESGAFDEVVLTDIQDGLAAGTALDLWHGASITGCRTRVRGTESIADAGPADIYIVTAGRARQPGMSRSDLVETNAAIIRSVAADIRATSPDAVIIVVTNPLDEMCDLMWRETGFPHQRVVGMAGQLDTARFRSLLALEPQVGDPAAVHAYALGSHGAEMVIPLSQVTVAGRPAVDLVPQARLDAVIERARDSGGEVVGLLKTGSAYLTPGTAAAQMAVAVATNSGQVFASAVKPDGVYDLPDVHVGLPAALGADGVQRVIELDLTDAERSELRDAAAAIQERLLAMQG